MLKKSTIPLLVFMFTFSAGKSQNFMHGPHIGPSKQIGSLAQASACAVYRSDAGMSGKLIGLCADQLLITKNKRTVDQQ